MAELYNEHHDGMTREGADFATHVDNTILKIVEDHASLDNIFELESILMSSVGSACAGFRIKHGLLRRNRERSLMNASVEP